MFAHLLLTALGMVAADPAAPLVLADAGKTTYQVVVAKDAQPAERYAAEELARFLSEISGAAFTARQLDAAETPGPQTIRVGAGAAGELVTQAEIDRLGQEGYLYRTSGASLIIAGGRPRGTLYGVYSLLEDELGCRWFTPDVSRIPERKKLELGPLDRSFVPRLEYRATDYPKSREGDWAARNKLNGSQIHADQRHGGRIAYGAFVHTFDSILSPQEHFATHPEYFSEVRGKRLGQRTQLCTSNPQVQQLAIERVREWIRQHPEATIFSVSQNDWYNFCTCPQCAAIAAEEGSQIGPYLRMVNSIADAVREEYPDRIIDTLAYQFTRQPPTKTVPRPNVAIRLCSIECCFAHGLSESSSGDPRNEAFARDLAGWSKLTGRLHIWDYVINYAHSVMPFPNLWTLKQNINFFVDHGVKGIYEEANYFSPGGELAELRTWIIAKTLWDPSYDTNRAIDEFLAGYYAEAAGPMRRYIDLVHDRARQENLHFGIFDAPSKRLFAANLLDRADELFREAEQAVAARPEVLERVRLAALPIKYVRITQLQPAANDADAPQRRQRIKELVEQFDAVARKAGITHLSEGRTYDAWLQKVRGAASE